MFGCERFASNASSSTNSFLLAINFWGVKVTRCTSQHPNSKICGLRAPSTQRHLISILGIKFRSNNFWQIKFFYNHKSYSEVYSSFVNCLHYLYRRDIDRLPWQLTLFEDLSTVQQWWSWQRPVCPSTSQLEFLRRHPRNLFKLLQLVSDDRQSIMTELRGPKCNVTQLTSKKFKNRI